MKSLFVLLTLLSLAVVNTLSAVTVALPDDETVVGAGDDKPRKIVLEQNIPNPFNSITAIRYGLPGSSYVRLTVYTMIGNPVAVLVNARQEAGTYIVEFPATDLPSGIYLYQLQTEFGSVTRRMTVWRQ